VTHPYTPSQRFVRTVEYGEGEVANNQGGGEARPKKHQWVDSPAKGIFFTFPGPQTAGRGNAQKRGEKKGDSGRKEKKKRVKEGPKGVRPP